MNERRRMTGTVTSNKMIKTVVVKVERTYRHPLYRKVVHASSKIKAHDELGCAIGDVVVMVESAPISREKAWVVESIVKREGKNLDVVEEAIA
jgi:small subunit ribosomal protein S17